MKFLLCFVLLLSLLSLEFALETEPETGNGDQIETISEATAALAIDDEPGLPNMTDPDFDDFDNYDDESDIDPLSNSNSESNVIEPRECRGRCRSRTNDCVWKCSDDWSRVVKPCHEYRPCTRDRRHCSVLANAQEWATCK